MVAGHGSRDQGETRRYAYNDPQAFAAIIDAITELTVEYLARQIENGVEAVQLFDSWAGSLSPAQFERWVIAPNAAIVAKLKTRCPQAVIIGFPKGAGGKLPAYARETGVMRWDWTRRSILSGRIRSCPRECRCRAISIRWR